MHRANAVIVLAHAPVAARMDVRLAKRVDEARLRDPESAPMIAALLHPERSYDLTIAFSPAHESATVRVWLRGADRYEPQATGDVGLRIANATERAFARGHERVVVVGAHDEHHIVTRERLEDALQWLEQVDCVLGPIESGTYWIVGSRVPVPGLRELPWGKAELLERTRERLLEADLSWCEVDRTAVRVGETRQRRAR